MNVLLSAYACMPDAGSEPGSGWNWALRLADLGMNVTVLTRGEGRRPISEYMAAHPNPRLSFEFLDVPVSWFQSGRAWHYLVWQIMAGRVAKRLHKARRFDIAHHVTFTSVHVPTQVWRAGVPTVFGSVGGGQIAPESMLPYFGPAQRGEKVRTLLTRALAHSRWHKYCFRKMALVLAANADTYNLLRQLSPDNVRMEFDVGIPESALVSGPKSFAERRPPRLIWVGRMLPRKALPLALDALASSCSGATLTIVGNGLPPQTVHDLISARGLQGRVTWAGRRLSLEEVQAAYRDHDAFLFTSLRDTCGVQLLEAMAAGLPVITLDIHGARDLVPGAGGYKIEVGEPEQVVRDLGQAIDAFAAAGEDTRIGMSAVNLELARLCTWTERAKKTEAVYRSILEVPQRGGNTLRTSAKGI